MMETPKQVINWQKCQYPEHITIEGTYCNLQPLDTKLHSKSLFEALSSNETDYELWKYLPFGPFQNYADFVAWLQERSKNRVVFVIIDRENNNSLQGIATYHDIDINHGVIEVGSVIYSNQLQKTRVATEVMYLMMKNVFEKYGYRRYQWRCNALNNASRKAAERLGFKFEGIFRNSNVFKGYNRDTAWYSIIDDEWLLVKIKFEKWLVPTNFDEFGNQLVKLQEI